MDPAPNAPFNPEPDVSEPTTTATTAKPDAVVVVATGEKRPAGNGIGNGYVNLEESDMNSVNKRARRSGGGGGGVVGDKGAAKRVAEIVLVLSAMLRMRGGGKAPTEAETKLMAEAREKLVEMCAGLAPKDIVSKDRIEKLIEDLGLNGRVKEQRLGFRGHKLSIKEKLELTKKKMEDSKKFTTQPATYAPHALQTNFGAAADNRGTSHSVRIFPPDKMSPSPTVSAGGFPASSPPVHVSAATSTSLPYQLHTNEARVPTVSTGFPGSHLGRDSASLALPRVDRAQIKVDGGINASSYVSQAQVNSSTNHQLMNSASNHPLVNAPTWSVQTHPASSAKPGAENKFPSQNPLKVDGTAVMARTAPQAAPQTFRSFITQPASGNLPVMHQASQGANQASQGVNLGQAPQSSNNHSEIAKMVQRLLHPKLPEHPTWTPPSREYMNKALTCQLCKLTVNEVETVALCDACEKGFHLKCLQLNNQKGIPRGGEWHCMSCLKLSGGKPLPPKYGRVMRSINTPPKMPSNTSVFQSSSDKKVAPMDSKVSSQKIAENGSSSDPGNVGSNSTELASDSNIQIAKDQEASSRTHLNNSTLGVITDSPSVDSVSKKLAQANQVCESSVHEDKLASESKSLPPVTPETVSNNSASSQPSHNTPVVQTDPPNGAEVSLNDHQNNCTVKQDEKNDAQSDPVGSSGLSVDFLHGVEWSGDVVQIVDGKLFYQSCCIGGVTYKLQDHALLHSSPDRLIPSKLQAMWEDTRTGYKWVMVNRCFFPGDLPEAVGCPCSPESSELYESNNESTVMAGLIRGLCEVLPSAKFREESERQSQLGTEANNGRRPVFLCKWFYDEVKGVFRPVSG
ncbi:hypothetical protein Dsin_023254 [Dipteronia sinensis]|uniref:PHD finger protein n=1 Tax=Dipteronia sinensis TaxID=43782 RepID=A0AAE0E0V7_9ROSI|nr:hypothetical protein Dsin_023254 [Dipteronia sinensis]